MVDPSTDIINEILNQRRRPKKIVFLKYDYLNWFDRVNMNKNAWII